MLRENLIFPVLRGRNCDGKMLEFNENTDNYILE